MIVRGFLPGDIEQLKAIHSQYDFPFPDFSKMLSYFVIEEGNKIITAGGVRYLTEAILITDKNSDARVRRDALMQASSVVQFISKNLGHDLLHCFVTDDEWESVLKKHGFRNSTGKALIIG